jgi:hypothetical protein
MLLLIGNTLADVEVVVSISVVHSNEIDLLGHSVLSGLWRIVEDLVGPQTSQE